MNLKFSKKLFCSTFEIHFSCYPEKWVVPVFISYFTCDNRNLIIQIITPIYKILKFYLIWHPFAVVSAMID